MSALDDKPFGVESGDQSLNDQGVANKPTDEFEGKDINSSTYNGPKLPYEQEVNGSVSKAQLANVGRK